MSLFDGKAYLLFLTKLCLSIGTVAGSFFLGEAMPELVSRSKRVLESFGESREVLVRRKPGYS